MLPFSVEDPESSKPIKPFQKGEFLRGHPRGRNPLFQFQQSPIIHPPEEREKVPPEESLFSESKTAIEIDQERFSFFRDKDVPFMSQIHVDHPFTMNLLEHTF
jgi:hypothetical protein